MKSIGWSQFLWLYLVGTPTLACGFQTPTGSAKNAQFPIQIHTPRDITASGLAPTSRSLWLGCMIEDLSSSHRQGISNDHHELASRCKQRNRLLVALASTRGGDGGEIEPNGEEEDNLAVDKALPTDKTLSQLFSLFWQMASPYYGESKSGRWLFWGVIGLTLLNSGVSVAFSYLGKDFWNALSSKDVEAFYGVLKQYVPALLVGAPVATYYKFQRAQLAVSWREWMTERTLQIYSSERVYYALERGKEIDNPDQR